MNEITKNIGETSISFNPNGTGLHPIDNKTASNYELLHFYRSEYAALPDDEKELIDAYCEAFEVKTLEDYRLAYDALSPDCNGAFFYLDRDNFKPLNVWNTSHGLLVKCSAEPEQEDKEKTA